MQCPSCGTANSDEYRFCHECGTPLAATCPSCGATVEGKFCGRCGARVEAAEAATPVSTAAPAAAAPVSERRVVSVLFADLVGFTPLSESRDPEEVRELLSRYFDRARTLIARYGGVVEKFIGDAVMAVWGVPTAHGDDAERCVRAALDLVDSVAALGGDVGVPTLAARAGIVTGEVAVTVGAKGEGMVAGDAVNTAARVQGEAEPGTVLVDDVTRQTTAAAIGYADTGPHILKGKADPARLWRATRVVGTVGGSERVDGLEASFLGRDRELRAVKDGLHTVLDTGRARLLSVVGAAGVGKSRLRWEFFKYTDGLLTELLWHSGRCLPYGDGVAYWALAEIVRARLGISEEEPVPQATVKLAAGLDRWIPDEAERAFLTPRLGALIGVAEPGLSRDDLFAGWRLWLERLTEDAPVVVVIEDLQWADAGLLDFLEHLLDWSADKPLFILTLGRPELLERRPTWGASHRNSTSLTLDPLPDPVMAQLLDELVPELPAEVQQQIIAQADGIPLYAVELVRSLIDRDVVQPVEGVYRLVGAVESLDAPASLSSLVTARIDALPADERALVQGLAVLGGTFPRAAVAAVCDRPEPEADRMLADLVRKEILSVRTDRLSPDRGQYAFTQSLLRQVAYDTLSRRDRKARHLTVADHLRHTFPDDGYEVVEVIARHYLEAHQAVPDDPDTTQIRDLASDALRRAAHRALALGAPATAQRSYVAAADLAEGADQVALLAEAGRAALRAGQPEDALAIFQRAEQVDATTGRTRGAELGALVGRALVSLGRGREAIPRLQAAIEPLGSDRADGSLGTLHITLAMAMSFAGRSEEAGPHVEAALEIAQALGDAELLVWAATNRGYWLTSQNRVLEALGVFEWAAALAEQHGLTEHLARALANVCDVRFTMDLPGALTAGETSTEIMRRLGNRAGESNILCMVALVEMFAGDWEEAGRRLAAALTGYEGEVRPGEGFLHARLAMLRAWRGDIPGARSALTYLDEWTTSDDAEMRGMQQASAALVARAAGDPTETLRISLPVVGTAMTELGVRNEVIRTMWPEAVEAALQLGDHTQAAELLTMLSTKPPGHVPPYLRAQLDRFEARLRAARGADGVDELFGRATASLRELGYPYWLSLTQLDHAQWLVTEGRDGEARLLLDEALGTLERLGAAPAAERARALADQPGQVALPPVAK